MWNKSDCETFYISLIDIIKIISVVKLNKKIILYGILRTVATPASQSSDLVMVYLF